VDEPVYIPRREYKTPTQLERILPQLNLLESLLFRTLPIRRVISPQQMKNVCLPQLRRFVRFPPVVDQQWERYTGLFAKHARVVRVAQPDRSQVRALLFKLSLMLAQLRGVLAAEDSTIVPQEDDHRRPFRPQRSQLNYLAVTIRQTDIR
jgi:hypothetical protein